VWRSRRPHSHVVFQQQTTETQSFQRLLFQKISGRDTIGKSKDRNTIRRAHGNFSKGVMKWYSVIIADMCICAPRSIPKDLPHDK
jgi:hypothetical protein